jgi:hypothetical protein
MTETAPAVMTRAAWLNPNDETRMTKDEGMAGRERVVRASVVIRQTITDRTFRGTLPNGREIFIFVPRMIPLPLISTGDTVIASLSLGDFSRGEFVQAVPHQP